MQRVVVLYICKFTTRNIQIKFLNRRKLSFFLRNTPQNQMKQKQNLFPYLKIIHALLEVRRITNLNFCITCPLNISELFQFLVFLF